MFAAKSPVLRLKTEALETGPGISPSLLGGHPARYIPEEKADVNHKGTIEERARFAWDRNGPGKVPGGLLLVYILFCIRRFFPEEPGAENA